MELPQLVVCEWRENHRLSRPSLLWIHHHADVDDPHPVATAVAMLRATVTDTDTASARSRDPQSVTVARRDDPGLPRPSPTRDRADQLSHPEPDDREDDHRQRTAAFAQRDADDGPFGMLAVNMCDAGRGFERTRRA